MNCETAPCSHDCARGVLVSDLLRTDGPHMHPLWLASYRNVGAAIGEALRLKRKQPWWRR